ncbi:MAG: hypothetical protein PF445_00645 [Melioribacteraceae bacterium]|nr:hypothetical protein [Melioribacteraceae bacterium]
MKKIILIIISLSLIYSCSNETNIDLLKIELAGDLAERKIEASGLTWYKDNLIILPQFPHKWDEQFDGAIYFIPKEKIVNYINGESKTPLSGEKIYFSAEGLDEIGKRKGSGYEAIVLVKDTVYVCIESLNGDESASYVVKGMLDFEQKQIILDAKSKFEINSQSNIHNMGEETILEFQNNIYAIHEANGININKSPFATKLNSASSKIEKISMPNLDFRITDATCVDSTGKFFAINYFYPGEFEKLKPNINEEDKNKAVEQILEFQILGGKIAKTDRKPIKLLNEASEKGHNWEGIVKLNDGFLVITDMFPETILSYYK